MAKIQVQTEIDTQSLLMSVSQMPIPELEYFRRELNALITRKKTKSKDSREKFLLHKINRTALDPSQRERYSLLIQKLETETISSTEHEELTVLVTTDEKLRNNRVKYLIELSQLRSVSLIQLMEVWN